MGTIRKSAKERTERRRRLPDARHGETAPSTRGEVDWEYFYSFQWTTALLVDYAAYAAELAFVRLSLVLPIIPGGLPARVPGLQANDAARRVRSGRLLLCSECGRARAGVGYDMKPEYTLGNEPRPNRVRVHGDTPPDGVRGDRPQGARAPGRGLPRDISAPVPEFLKSMRRPSTCDAIGIGLRIAVSARRLPEFKDGARLLIRRTDLVAYIAAQARGSGPSWWRPRTRAGTLSKARRKTGAKPGLSAAPVREGRGGLAVLLPLWLPRLLTPPIVGRQGQ